MRVRKGGIDEVVEGGRWEKNGIVIDSTLMCSSRFYFKGRTRAAQQYVVVLLVEKGIVRGDRRK